MITIFFSLKWLLKNPDKAKKNTNPETSSLQTQEPNSATKTPDATKPAPTWEAAQEHSKRLANPDISFSLTIDEDKLINGPSEMTVKQGQSVRISINAVSEEVKARLEGYNIITESYAFEDPPGGFHFIADKTGEFKFYARGEDGPEKHIGTVIVK